MAQITVVMAVYDAMPYLPAAVESILRQTLADFKFVIVNDGSRDGSREYLEGLTDPRILLLHQENQGQQAAANRGIAASETELIARMDADDIASPERLALQVRYLDRCPNVGLVGGQILRLGAHRAGLRSNFPSDHGSIVKSLLRNHHSMCNGTIMFRRELFERIGGYWNHNISEDWDMFLKMGELAELSNLDDVLLSCRFHRGSINGRRIVEAQLYNEYAAFLARQRRMGRSDISIEAFLASHRSQKWPFSWMFYLDCQSIGQYREAVAEIYSNRRMLGYLRLLFSMAISPNRTLRRVRSMLTPPLPHRGNQDFPNRIPSDDFFETREGHLAPEINAIPDTVST